MASKEIKKKKTAKKTMPKKGTIAFHAKLKDGSAMIGLDNLHVVIVKDADQWFAQGLEVDYAAQGISEKDVKKQFEDGLCATIHEHLCKFGNIEHFLYPAPPEIWKEMLYDNVSSPILKSYSQISAHRNFTKALPKEAGHFPFDKIQYLEPELAVA